MPPILEAILGAGEFDLGPKVASLDTWATGAGASPLSGVLGPATRRSRSSSWVLSLGESGPTICQIFSPTRTYPSLSAAREDFLTFGSLSEIAVAITGKALPGSQAPIPKRFSTPAISSSVPCRVLATFDFKPCSRRIWKTRLKAYTFGSD